MTEAHPMKWFSFSYRGDQEPDDLAEYDGPHEVHLPSLYQRGLAAFCICGWHPHNHPGFIVADHMRDMGVEQ